jgi:eukaryotic-like serine/threonine-protein kinase
MIETGLLLQNRYLIEKQIGEGGMGAVYLAIDQRFDSRVAIKETFYQDDHLRDAFEREARLLNSLHHPVLPHVSDFFTEGDKHFLVMEFIEGEDLSEILKREGAFAPADFLRWANQLLDALDYLHSQEPPIIHRDIKPQNLKITTRGDIVLLDFGLAKLASSETTSNKSVFGYSRTYSPLEQIEGTGTDARSDIFALGASGYHLLTGKPPLDALKRAAAVVNGKPDPLLLASEINSAVPVPIAQVLQTALALNPEMRFASAKAMRQAINFAVNSDAEGKLPKEVAKAVAANSSSTNFAAGSQTDFPALAAFAAEAVNNPALQIEDAAEPAIQVAVPSTGSPKFNVTNPASTATVRDEPTQVVKGANKSWLTAAAALAVLLGGLTVWFTVNRTNSSAEPNQKPAAQATPTVNANLPIETAVSSQPSAQISPSPTPTKERTASASPTPAAVIRNDKEWDEREERSSQTPAPASTPKAERAETKPQPRPAQTPRREQEPSVSDIERVLTGEPSVREERRRRREERRARRRQPLSDAEREELRRQRTQDVLRQNRRPLPPN